jgi:uncharacterized protein YciI
MTKRRVHADATALETALARRARHARDLPSSVVAFGNLLSDSGNEVEGYVYFFDVPVEHEAREILATDALVEAGLEEVCMLSRWKRAFGKRQSELEPKEDAVGFLFLGIGKPAIHHERERLLAAHLSYLARYDAEGIVARGPLLSAAEGLWIGSAVAFELPDQAAMDDYYRSEPFVLGGLYESTMIKRWDRATARQA